MSSSLRGALVTIRVFLLHVLSDRLPHTSATTGASDRCHSGLSPLSRCQLRLTVEKGVHLQLLILTMLFWALFLIYSVFHVFRLLAASQDPHPTHF